MHISKYQQSEEISNSKLSIAGKYLGFYPIDAVQVHLIASSLDRLLLQVELAAKRLDMWNHMHLLQTLKALVLVSIHFALKQSYAKAFLLPARLQR